MIIPDTGVPIEETNFLLSFFARYDMGKVDNIIYDVKKDWKNIILHLHREL